MAGLNAQAGVGFSFFRRFWPGFGSDVFGSVNEFQALATGPRFIFLYQLVSRLWNGGSVNSPLSHGGIVKMFVFSSFRVCLPVITPCYPYFIPHSPSKSLISLS